MSRAAGAGRAPAGRAGVFDELVFTADDMGAVGAAVLVGMAHDRESRPAVERSLDELEGLVRTLGGEAAVRLVQVRRSPDPACLVGRGMVQRISWAVEDSGAAMVVFDEVLTPAQHRNLERMLKVPVYDRYGVILAIFSRHARTSVARLQVELARLQYVLPRLRRQWTHLSRQRGGIGLRGIGEKQLENDRRLIRRRIAVLKRKLEKVERQRTTQRKGRSDVFSVALVGYTNSGKSTLLNRLCGADVVVADRLFSTLDARVRNFAPPMKPVILMCDTVGFIDKLPPGLVSSFKSTLDEVRCADLLLHVVDVSHPDFERQMKVTDSILEELGVAAMPRIHVFNKRDKLGDSSLPRVLQAMYPSSVSVSAITGEGLDVLRRMIADHFRSLLRKRVLVLDYEDGDVVSFIYEHARVESVEYRNDSVAITFLATAAHVRCIERFLKDTRHKGWRLE